MAEETSFSLARESIAREKADGEGFEQSSISQGIPQSSNDAAHNPAQFDPKQSQSVTKTGHSSVDTSIIATTDFRNPTMQLLAYHGPERLKPLVDVAEVQLKGATLGVGTMELKSDSEINCETLNRDRSLCFNRSDRVLPKPHLVLIDRNRLRNP